MEHSATEEQAYVNSEVLKLSGIGASPKVDIPAQEYESLRGQPRDRESQVKSVTRQKLAIILIEFTR